MVNIFSLFNFSYSTYNVYCNSPLWFYFLKIAKAEPSNKIIDVYGDAGNCVHNPIDEFHKYGKTNFREHWKKADIDNRRGFNNEKLDYIQYDTMFQSGIKKYNSIKQKNNIVFSELKIDREYNGMRFKAFIDLYARNGNDITIFDWKTDKKYTKDKHKIQRLLYSWLIFKITGHIPKCEWVYLRDSGIVKNHFSREELNDFEINHINKFREDIKKKGTDISQYEAENWKNPFNPYRDLCAAEIERREEKNKFTIELQIVGSHVLIRGVTPKKLLHGIDYATKFDSPEKYWMQKKVKEKGGIYNLDDIGTFHLYNSKYRCVPIGLLPKVKKIIQDYAKYYNKKIDIKIIDCRDKTVVQSKINLPEKLNTNLIERSYQQEAKNIFLKKNMGILHLPTGSGKTFIAAHIIHQAKTKTLWIIDRKELMTQTKNTLQKTLGVDIGVIASGTINIQDITIATVQSLSSKLSKIKDYLKEVNFFIIDEYHKSAADTYQKIISYLPNAKYRLGLTATPYRDDGKDPILFGAIGDIIYSVSAQYLIKKGFLVQPKIIFKELRRDYLDTVDSYNSDYINIIVENQERNNYIKSICEDSGKTLILTKQIQHGKLLQSMIPESQFIHGSLKKEIREKIFHNYRKNKFLILIMTLSIGAEGLDIPDLCTIINAAANKGDVKSIQIIGRIMRLFKNKNAKYYDFIDGGKYTRKHSKKRIQAFEKNGYKIKTCV